MVRPGDDGHVRDDGFPRRPDAFTGKSVEVDQARRQGARVESASRTLPAAGVGSVGIEESKKSLFSRVLGAGPARHHRLEEGERQAHACAAQESSTRQGTEDHGGSLLFGAHGSTSGARRSRNVGSSTKASSRPGKFSPPEAKAWLIRSPAHWSIAAGSR